MPRQAPHRAASGHPTPCHPASGQPAWHRSVFAGCLVALAGLAGCAAPMDPFQATVAPGGTSSTNCAPITEHVVVNLFNRWNASLGTGEPRKVAANYAPHSILLPTVSNKPRYSPEEKIDYFEHFLHDGPVGKIDQRFIQLGCNTALDAGLYTFTFSKTGAVVHARYSYTYGYINGQWLITSHHSSGMPEKAGVAAGH